MTRAEAGLIATVLLVAAFVAREAATVRSPRAAVAERAPAESLAAGSEAAAGDVRVETQYSALPAPVRDTAAVRRLLLLAGTNTYIDDLLQDGDSTLARWPNRIRAPISVWVQPSPAVAAWRPEYDGLARDAFARWELVGLPVRFVFTGDSAAAEVHVRWVERLDVGARIGSTRRVHDQHWWVLDGDITLATHSVDGRPLPPEVVRATALHEVGHLLGLGHAADSTVIMAPKAYGTSELTPRDLATVRLLYSLPPGRIGR